MAERVWDKFLTEQDKAHLALVPHKASGFGDNPALLLIDLYRWVSATIPSTFWTPLKIGPAVAVDAWDRSPTSRHCSRRRGMPAFR